MTMRELARLCNVSVSAVSKAFSGAEDISNETRELVFKTAKQYGCYGKFYKNKYHKKIIAIISSEIIGGYYSVFVNMLKELIEKNDGICVVSFDDFDAKKQAELIEYYVSYLKVDGIIVFGLKEPMKKGYDVPIVSVFSSKDNNVDSVKLDMGTAINEAVETLYSFGHRKFAFLGESHTKRKESIFETAIKEKKDCSYTVIESNLRFEEAGVDGIKQLLESENPFTAVICAYDNIGFGAIKELKARGYSIPEDVSIVGIDNVHTSKFAETSLTTIDVKPSDVCSIVFDLLCKKLKNKYFSANQRIAITPRLIVRESVSTAKKEVL